MNTILSFLSWLFWPFTYKKTEPKPEPEHKIHAPVLNSGKVATKKEDEERTSYTREELSHPDHPFHVVYMMWLADQAPIRPHIGEHDYDPLRMSDPRSSLHKYWQQAVERGEVEVDTPKKENESTPVPDEPKPETPSDPIPPSPNCSGDTSSSSGDYID